MATNAISVIEAGDQALLLLGAAEPIPCAWARFIEHDVRRHAAVAGDGARATEKPTRRRRSRIVHTSGQTCDAACDQCEADHPRRELPTRLKSLDHGAAAHEDVCRNAPAVPTIRTVAVLTKVSVLRTPDVQCNCRRIAGNCAMSCRQSLSKPAEVLVWVLRQDSVGTDSVPFRLRAVPTPCRSDSVPFRLRAVPTPCRSDSVPFRLRAVPIPCRSDSVPFRASSHACHFQ
jgi:hypothetical protein